MHNQPSIITTLIMVSFIFISSVSSDALWPDSSLLAAPAISWIDSIGPDYSLIYENVPYKGKMASVFAYYSVPTNINGKHPAMVLVHGGGGTAFQVWAKQWASWGYAAIAMDLGNNNVPYGRPHDTDNFNSGETMPLTDSWYYHAPSAVIRAISFLTHQPEVDTTRIGLMGISWGGWITSIVSGVDNRLLFSIPVYGTGFIWENSHWLPVTSPSYINTFDPANYLGGASLPMLWVSGLADCCYTGDSRRKSYRLTSSTYTLSIRANMYHDHVEPRNTPEIRRYADSFCKGGPPLLRFTEISWEPGSLQGNYEGDISIKKSELIYTTDTKPWANWIETQWISKPALTDTTEKLISAEVPPNAVVFYLLISDKDNMLSSSQHVDLTIDADSGSASHSPSPVVSLLPQTGTQRSPVQVKNVSLYDILGRTVYTGKMKRKEIYPGITLQK